MLCMCISSWWVRSVHALVSWRARSVHPSVPYANAQHVLKGPFQICNFSAYAQHKPKKLLHMFKVCCSSWRVCSGYASVPNVYAHHVLKRLRLGHVLVPDTYSQRTHQFLNCLLSDGISSWCVCLTYASVHDTHAQCMYHFFTRMMRVSKMNILKWENWCGCWACL